RAFQLTGVQTCALPIMQGYVPGEQMNDPDVIKLNTNESPYPAAPQVAKAISDETAKAIFNKYPDPTCAPLRRSIATRLGITLEDIGRASCSDSADDRTP